MGLLANDEALNVFLFLDRDALDTLELSTKRLKCFIAECMNDVCLRYFELAELSKSGSTSELTFTLRGVNGSVCVKETKPKKAVDFMKSIPMFAKHLRMANIGKLSISNVPINGELIEAMEGVSSSINVNKLMFWWARFGVDFDLFHNIVLGLRSVREAYIHADYANCVSDALLIGLTTKGATKFEQTTITRRYHEPLNGISEAALLEFCFGKHQKRGLEDVRVKLDCMLVSDEFFAKVIQTSQHSKQRNNVEMEIRTTSRIIQKLHPELQQARLVEGRDDDEHVYTYAFECGNPRTVMVHLIFHDAHARGPPRPCYPQSKRCQKRLPGRFFKEKLMVTYT